MTVKILLREMRTARKLSQNKLAQLMNMSLQNIQRMEYGDAKSIPLDTLDRLCEVLNCQPGDLLIRIPDGDTQKISSNSAKLSQEPDSEPNHDDDSSSIKSLSRHTLKLVTEIPESA